MARALQIAAGVALVAVVAVVAHYAVVVQQARQATPAIVERVLASDAMRLELADFPPGWIEALLAVEDPAFYAHDGMDLRSPGAGLTTLTQAMVKYLYFDDFQPGLAKLRQTLIAVFALDALVDKDTQLLMFVNTIGLGQWEGRTVRGFGAAAEAYYGKPFAELTRREYLALLAMPIAPENFHVVRRPESNARRVDRIERLLRGEYVPKGLMDQYYGTLTEQEQENIAPFSYVPPDPG